MLATWIAWLDVYFLVVGGRFDMAGMEIFWGVGWPLSHGWDGSSLGGHGCWLHGSPGLVDIFLVWEGALTWLGWKFSGGWDGRFHVAGTE
eukprot:3652695-Amphidinium_carterae.1